MSALRLALLAIFAWVGVAAAQVPPPVPALPDTQRVTTYALTASTCNCSVGFALYGDSTDYWDWVEVWIDGVNVPYNSATTPWTITSPTGPIATIPRPISDGALAFGAPVTGTVRIVGARRPRRVTQFTESRGVAARDLNQALTDIVAQNRETWDRTNDLTGRAILARPGLVMGSLPSPAACAGGYLAFDGTGLQPLCVATAATGGLPSNIATGVLGYSGGGTGPATSIPLDSTLQFSAGHLGVTPTTYTAPNRNWISPTDPAYGAKCDGSTDDTVALNNWLAALGTSGVSASPVYAGIIPGGTCTFTGPLTYSGHNALTIIGLGAASQLRYTGASTTATALTIGIINGGCSVSGVLLSDFLLSSATKMTAGAALILNNTCNTHVENVLVENNAGGAYGNWANGVAVNGGNQVYFINNEVSGSVNVYQFAGNDAGHSSTQLTDVRILGGIAIGGAVGVDFGGNVGGGIIDLGADILQNQTEVKISQDIVSIPNLQLFIGPTVALDSTSGALGRDISLEDPGSSNSVLTLTGTWIAGGAGNCFYVGSAATTWNIKMTGARLVNCGVNGIDIETSLPYIDISDLTINMTLAGFSGNTGYGMFCAASLVNSVFKNINFQSVTGSGNYNSSCNPGFSKYTAAGLSSATCNAAKVGARATVTDFNGTYTYGSATFTGGGTNSVGAFCNGTAWVQG